MYVYSQYAPTFSFLGRKPVENVSISYFQEENNGKNRELVLHLFVITFQRVKIPVGEELFQNTVVYLSGQYSSSTIFFFRKSNNNFKDNKDTKNN